ncbi:MAG: M23 family metallopeptidase [Armatimonadota bacterium]
MNHKLRLLGLLITLCLLTTGALETGVSAASSGSLRSKQSHLKKNAKAARAKIKELKKVQVVQRGKLTNAQKALLEAQRDLGVASQRLSSTRSTLSVVRKEHKRAMAKHQIQSKRMQARILAQFEAGNPSYLEVVLDATTFSDFTERAQMSEVIAERDQSFLNELLTTKQALARQKARLQEKEREEAEAREAVRRQRNEVAIKTELALTKLKDANAARAQAERELAAFEKASSQIEAMLARVQRAGVSGGAYSGSWGGSFLRPVPGRITSPFGWRIHPITRTRRFHDGVDLACTGGTPIKAADKGRVVHAGWYGVYGNSVIIDHGSGMSTLYAHARSGSLRVRAGEIVQRGQAIAGVGSTGWSTGNHLHFSVRRYGRPVQPN